MGTEGTDTGASDTAATAAAALCRTGRASAPHILPKELFLSQMLPRYFSNRKFAKDRRAAHDID